MQRANTVSPAVATLSSDVGTFAIGGTTVATFNSRISRVNTTPPGGRTFTTITEVITVPQSVAFQMSRNPGAVATFSRTFRDATAFTATGAARLVPTGGGSGQLGISRLDLAFEDGARIKIVQQKAPLRAIATINFTGSGTQRFEWQIATPASAAGALIFRTLRILNANLAGFSARDVKSPPLPTQTSGLHIIRLVPLDSTSGFSAPEIRYFVIPGDAALPAVPTTPLVLVAPPTGASLNTETQFSWRPTAGAVVYQLEMYARAAGRNPTDAANSSDRTREADAIRGDLLVVDERDRIPLTGVTLPADKNSVSLKSYSLARLEKGRGYEWRVKAINANGAVIATSPLVYIVVPR